QPWWWSSEPCLPFGVLQHLEHLVGRRGPRPLDAGVEPPAIRLRREPWLAVDRDPVPVSTTPRSTEDEPADVGVPGVAALERDVGRQAVCATGDGAVGVAALRRTDREVGADRVAFPAGDRRQPAPRLRVQLPVDGPQPAVPLLHVDDEINASHDTPVTSPTRGIHRPAARSYGRCP